jgi:large subunit ribosomal protein L3
MLGLICKKIGMTQVFGKEGEMVPVTVLEVGPCTVVQRKDRTTDGYDALQLGFCARKPKGMTKPERGHFEKKKLPLFSHLREFRTEKASEFQVGEELFAAAFKAGERVNVTGTSKGRGFQGVMKRHGKHGGPASHGSNFKRRPGSIGMRTMPARVPKNTRLPGHMGDVQVTTKGLEVVEVRADDNLILVRGAVPGATNGILWIAPAGELLDGREGLRKAEAKAEAPEKVEAEVKAEEKAEEKTEEKATEKTEEKPKE